jgi:hypothetical protein
MPHKHQIFISSQMKPNVLSGERRIVREVICKFNWLFVPWDWENDGPAGPKTPMAYCLQEVKQSYALVLIVGRGLTKHVRDEYELAVNMSQPTFVFFKKGYQRGKSLAFRKSLRPSWREFQNTSELETLFQLSLQDHIYTALREYRPATMTTMVKYHGYRL